LRTEPDAPRPAGVLDGDTKWDHDLYKDYDGVPRRDLTARLRSAPASGFKLCAPQRPDHHASGAPHVGGPAAAQHS